VDFRERTRSASAAQDAAPYLSVVIPVYNEQDNVAPAHDGLREALSGLGRTAEILFVDDGSTDATHAELMEIVARDRRVRVITLARNFGQTAAMMAGLDHARGEVVAMMDGDGQNDPHDLPAMLAKIEEGFDVVWDGGTIAKTGCSPARCRAGSRTGSSRA
jgi:glycosyltransferase involved in cell wall biosynthesis